MLATLSHDPKILQPPARSKLTTDQPKPTATIKKKNSTAAMAVRHKRARDGRRLKLYQWASGLGMTRSTRELAHRMQRTPGGDLTKGPERAATSAHQLGDAWLRARTVVPDGSAPARRSPRPRLPAPPRAGDGNRAPKDMLVRVSGTLVPSCVWGIAMDGSSKGRAISRSPDRHGGHWQPR